MAKDLKNIEVCFTPATYHMFHNDETNVVVVDILRATSAICTAFMNGVERIIPVATLEEAKEYKKKGYMVAAERDGIVRDFADFGNSPYNFKPELIKGKDIVYSTTNGTNAIKMAEKSNMVTIGAYLNITALANFLIEQQRDVVILCAGWKERFNLEDSVFAGALSMKLMESEMFDTICDSTLGAMDLWSIARNDLSGYTNKVAQKTRLSLNGLDDVIEYCLKSDLTNLIPVLKDDYLTTVNRLVETEISSEKN